MQKIKIGDNVRFLNAVGGGKVTRIDAKQSLLYVEDQDGFEVPILENECVVVPNVNEETNFPIKEFGAKTREDAVIQTVIPQVEKIEEIASMEVYETEYGDELRAFLVAIPQNIKNLQNTQFDVLLLNDSNYFLFYNIIIGEEGSRRSAAHGIIEPNIQVQIVKLSNDNLNDWENLQVQLIAYKQDKSYSPQSVIDFQTRLSPVKFYKLHSFVENDYFDEEAMMIELTDTNRKKLMEVSAEDIRSAMLQKDAPQADKNPRPRVKDKRKPILEIDLHIHELIDTTAGMDNAAILQLQLEKVESVLKENQQKKGQRIVFIHGKGEGVLRNEVLKLLKHKYKTYYVQDASFREYGFGATMVTIR